MDSSSRLVWSAIKRTLNAALATSGQQVLEEPGSSSPSFGDSPPSKSLRLFFRRRGWEEVLDGTGGGGGGGIPCNLQFPLSPSTSATTSWLKLYSQYSQTKKNLLSKSVCKFWIETLGSSRERDVHWWYLQIREHLALPWVEEDHGVRVMGEVLILYKSLLRTFLRWLKTGLVPISPKA